MKTKTRGKGMQRESAGGSDNENPLRVQKAGESAEKQMGDQISLTAESAINKGSLSEYSLCTHTHIHLGHTSQSETSSDTF